MGGRDGCGTCLLNVAQKLLSTGNSTRLGEICMRFRFRVQASARTGVDTSEGTDYLGAAERSRREVELMEGAGGWDAG
jgi:hypothetical protein